MSRPEYDASSSPLSPDRSIAAYKLARTLPATAALGLLLIGP